MIARTGASVDRTTYIHPTGLGRSIDLHPPNNPPIHHHQAIKQYTKTLDKIGDQDSELALKVFSNRAACYKQLSNFDGVISDCTSVLEVRPDDVKSLLRRAQAFEAVERYKMALQDVRTLLALPADVVGASNTTIAHGLQHRLNRVIAKLREG